MSKFNFKKTISAVQKSLGKDQKRSNQFGLGNSLTAISNDPKDYVVMPDWWQKSFGVMGLQFGKICQIAGDSDTGKTSLALEAIKRAQEQGIAVIYVETEGKTGPEDLKNKGIDPDGVMIVSTSITEEAFDGAIRLWEQFFEDYPEEKLLFVFDSFGNTVSMRDSEIDMTKESAKVGGASKINRLGLNTMIAKMQNDPVALLIVNYTYDNIGSVGKTAAGGKALSFFSMITLQSSRIGWITAVRGGVKVKLGAKVRWKVFKNHYAKSLIDDKGKQILLPDAIDLTITAEGINPVDSLSKINAEE